ncbi:MAG: hypothetical protein R3E54_05555 [Halioglobus sp.]
MSVSTPSYELDTTDPQTTVLLLRGDWRQGQPITGFDTLKTRLLGIHPAGLVADGSALGEWDSILMAFLLKCHDFCRSEGIPFETRSLPTAAEKLLAVATAVVAHKPPASAHESWLTHLNPARLIAGLTDTVRESLAFIGEVSTALWRLLTGRSNTRFTDFRHFCYQAGPDAFAIISLTSVLVGMILAYLGAVRCGNSALASLSRTWLSSACCARWAY